VWKWSHDTVKRNNYDEILVKATQQIRDFAWAYIRWKGGAGVGNGDYVGNWI
jgi:hypothetical protein